MKTRWLAVSVSVFLSLVVLLAVTGTGYAGWGAKWKKNFTGSPDIKEAVIKKAETADNISQASVEIMTTSSVPKLFWVDCGIGGLGENDICTGALRYVDPAEASPVVRTFDTGVTVFSDWDDNAIPAANINLDTYQMTNLKIAYVFYFKGGKIWKVDTTTLTKTQVSSESGATAATLCRVRPNNDWQDTNNSTIAYHLKGTDGWCYSGDDIRRAVKLSMSATTSPINLGKRNLMALLFGGGYIVEDWSTIPHRIRECDSNIANCTDITTRQNTSIWWWTEDYDAQRIVFHNLDGKLMIYNYFTNILTTLYTPLAGENIPDSFLDRDGYVYFAVTRSISPFTHSIRRVPVTGGSVTTLAPFSTTYPVYELDLEPTPTHVVYFYPNASFSAMLVRSIPKAGGTPVVISDAAIGGGAVDDYAFLETTGGAVQRVKLSDGTRVSRANTQLNAATLGGSADWHYGLNASTMRYFLSSIGNQLKSYAYGDNFTDPEAGVVIGTVPVNLNNFGSFALGNDLLGGAGKRDEWFSFGNDVLFLRAATPASLKRLTNTNGYKIILQGID